MKSIDELRVRYLPLVMLLLFEEKAVEVVVYEKRLSSNDGTTIVYRGYRSALYLNVVLDILLALCKTYLVE